MASCRLCAEFEASGDSELAAPAEEGAGWLAGHGGEDDEDDDALSRNGDSWEGRFGPYCGGSVVEDEGMEAEEDGGGGWCLQIGGEEGEVEEEEEKEEEEEEEEEEDGVVGSGERRKDGKEQQRLVTEEMEDRLFWERCLATGY